MLQSSLRSTRNWKHFSTEWKPDKTASVALIPTNKVKTTVADMFRRSVRRRESILYCVLFPCTSSHWMDGIVCSVVYTPSFYWNDVRVILAVGLSVQSCVLMRITYRYRTSGSGRTSVQLPCDRRCSMGGYRGDDRRRWAHRVQLEYSSRFWSLSSFSLAWISG